MGFSALLGTPGFAGIASGIGSVIGDIFGSSGQASANKANMALQQQSEQWQEMMSNTAMQRRVADLKAAGLNPLLATGIGGASPGSPVMPTMQNTGAAFQNLGGQVASAMGAYQSLAQANLAQSQAKNIDVDTGAKGLPVDAPATTIAQYLLKAQADQYKSAAGLNDDQASNVRQLTINAATLQGKLESEAASAKTAAEYAPVMAELSKTYAQIGNVLAQAQEPQAKANAEFFTKLGSLGTEGSTGMMKLGLQALMTLFGPRAGGGVLYNK